MALPIILWEVSPIPIGHTPAVQKQVGCFNHRVVTLVADKLETERFTLVWKTKWIRQPKKQLPSFSEHL